MPLLATQYAQVYKEKHLHPAITSGDEREGAMRKRIYWLLPDRASSKRMMDDLLLARVDESHIHFVAHAETDLTGLHPANVLQTSDVVRAAQLGVVIGGVIGAIAGAVAALFPVVGNLPQWGSIGVLAVLGGLVGAWVSSMIGSSTPSHRLRRFEAAIEAGSILLMVDVPRSRVSEIESMLQAAHPEARFEGVDPDIPAFP